jgi:hypothetical protein
VAEKFVTKPGRYGTLYLYAVTYRDRYDPGFGEGHIRLWGYNLEDVEDRFYDDSSDQEGDGFVIVSIARFARFGAPTTFVYHRRWSMIDLRRLVCLDCGYATSELPR